MATARSLSVDVVTGEVVSALWRAGIRSLLLKGPVLARWLWQDGEARPYVDTDLLVAPHDFDSAEEVLAELGFGQYVSDLEGAPHAHVWTRAGDRATVDLHRTLWGVDAPPTEVWHVLTRETEKTRVGGVEVEHLGAVGRAFHVALHAAAGNPGETKPEEDLERALARCEPAIWDRAAALAEELHAVGAFAAGLRQVPSGEREAARLRLRSNTSGAVALLARRARPDVAIGYERLFSTPTARGKLAILARELVPTITFMRIWSPLARKGPLGLCLAYLWRPWWLLASTPRALLTLRSARKEARAG